MKFARNVQFEIKPGMDKEFNRVMNAEVLPMLKRQKGFSEELTMLNHDKGVSISVWKDQASADAYVSATYPEILEKLNPMLTRAPHVDTYDVTTAHLAI